MYCTTIEDSHVCSLRRVVGRWNVGVGVAAFTAVLVAPLMSTEFHAHATEPPAATATEPAAATELAPETEKPHAMVSAAVSATDALDRLAEGNKRFAAEASMHDHESMSRRSALMKGQHPFAVIVGCADSRVPPELIFDQGFGDLFVIRNAGNLVATDVTASIEYAVRHLDTQLVVVMGHEGCGAITAALESAETRSHEPMELQAVLKMIEVTLSDHKHPADPKERVSAAVRANVVAAVKRLRYLAAEHADPELMKAKFVGAVYNMKSGTVDFFE
ncbi:carbonic anhydrase [Novipirellula artificiosorum]|uniref:Carbonic anhydrase n=1 Tax=Novipirellula artificiosorum TaxID=2528016 RepID=A0A5C6DG44_9BACT|nr:carbonic anhydrase [Novipirellula artificiosorum]TWU35155.1 Carbonic anhydrase 2 [Novipirellula artificiosorum]